MCGQWQRGRRQHLVYIGDGSSGREDVGGVWSTAEMVAARALAVSGAAAALATAVRELAAFGAKVAMVMHVVSGGGDGCVRSFSSKGDGGWRKQARAVSGSKGNRVERFYFSAEVRAAA